MSSSRLTNEQRQQWIDRIESWRASGSSISIARWCRENEIDYNKFLYWKERFCRQNKKNSHSPVAAFVELPEDKTHYTGIALECQGLRIHLSKQFDRTALQSLIVPLRRL